MRIAFLSTIFDYPWGGADFLWTRAAEAAAGRGDAIMLAVAPVVAEHPRIRALVTQGAALHLREKASAPDTFVSRVTRCVRHLTGTADGVVRMLGRFRPDLVIVSCGATYDLAFFPAWVDWLRSTRTKFRLVANWQSEQPVLDPAGTDRITRIFSLADALFFVSTRNLEVTRRHLRQPLPQARVVHNPLRWKVADVAPWPAQPPWTFATVSRLDAGKGVDLLLRAAAQVLPRTSDWRITVHGIGPEETALRTLATSLDLHSRIRFPGHVPDLRDIWAGHHLMVSPSLEDGVPMTIPEALLCQRPVLATAVGGAEDWVQDGVTGFICPTPSPASFAQTLQRAWNHRDQWESMGRAGARSASDRYRPDDYLQLIR